MGGRAIAVGAPTFLIYNPFAGKLQRHPGLMEEAVAVLRGRYGALELRPTYGPGSAAQIAADAVAAGASRILVAGGDGTINEAANGMVGSEVPLGILPGGTANVLAMELRIGGNLVRAAQLLGEMECAPVPLGRLYRPGQAPRYFLLMAGFGLDARVVRAVDPALKRRLGKLAYWVGGFSQLGRRLPEFDVRIDGKPHRASFALVSRVKNYGGDLEIARHADLLAPTLAVVLFQGESTIPYLKYFSGVLLNRLAGMRGVTLATANAVEVLAGREPVNVQVDGELLGEAPVRVEVAAGALNMMLPPHFLKARRPPVMSSVSSGTR